MLRGCARKQKELSSRRITSECDLVDYYSFHASVTGAYA